MSAPSKKSEAWALFDEIVARASAPVYSNPWSRDQAGQLVYTADLATLRLLLGVPLLLRATSRTGVPALALDVWTAYELRRAGFEPDLVWPRATAPRILPSTLVAFLDLATRPQRKILDEMIRSSKTYHGEVGDSANILGKNYAKQVDVVMSAWNTGPEIMISTKRMDSSFGNNAANRVEESYGDAKNLRSRHPQAALGFIFALRSTAFKPKTRLKADWIVDLLGKLGREDDAYDAVALIIPDWPAGYSSEVAEVEDDSGDVIAPEAAGPLSVDEDGSDQFPLVLPPSELEDLLSRVPLVDLIEDEVPIHLTPGVFFAQICSRVLDNCPIDFHVQARRRRADS